MSKILLDLDALLKEGKITQSEYDKFISFSKHDTGSLAIKILTVFACLAIAGGFLLLFSGFFQGILTSLFNLLGSTGIYVLAISLFIGGGVLFNSGFLVACSAFVIMKFLGSDTFYTHARYSLIIQDPFNTIVAFSLLSALAYILSTKLQNKYKRISIIFSRTCLFIVNLGFWVGSLWGENANQVSISWAIALFAVGVWGAKEGKRFVVNIVATFGAIHFYTQWFETFGAQPISLLFCGVGLLGLVYGLAKYNKRATAS